MIQLSNITSLSYEVENEVCIIHLKKSVPIEGFQRKEVRYKMDYKMFLKKSIEWRKYHSSV